MCKIIYHIDDTFVSIKKIRVVGWAVSEDGLPITYHSKKNVDVTMVERPDVNKCFSFLDKDIKTGFNIVIKGILPHVIRINSESGDFVDIKIQPFHLKCKYLKEGWIKFLSKVKEKGFVSAVKLSLQKLKHRGNQNANLEYMEWRQQRLATEEELQMQKRKKFHYEPLISIVVPTYNTPVKFLKEMIESVIQQSYTKWELCIADGASQNKQTIQTLKAYEEKYKNIRVVYLDENKMISENTNAALQIVNGEFVALFDHDDLLEPNALYEMVQLLNDDSSLDMIYTDEDKTNSKCDEFFEPHFKQDFSKYTLLSYNYITHFTLIRKSILEKVGGFDAKCDGAQDFDMFLRISDVTNRIRHIPKVLYHWRVHDQSTAASASAKTYVTDAGKYALEKYLKRNHIVGDVNDGLFPTSYKISYQIQGSPMISIIIPNKDHIDDLEKCIQSILNKTTYDNYEIIIVENNSTEEATFTYYNKLEKSKRIKILYWKDEFNYSAINNYGVKHAQGDYILLLNNDVEIINKEWLNEMLMLAQLEDVGAVGAKLYYSDDTIQHAGIIIGIGGVAGHSHKYLPRDSFGYVGRLRVIQNVSAVTAACLLVRKSIFEEVGGLDEGYKVAFNDVDFCMKILEKGYKNVFTPYAELYHYESKSRGIEDTKEKIERFNGEIKRFESKWGLWLEDPYYNINLSITHENFSLRGE